jgi:hypothetical protein
LRTGPHHRYLKRAGVGLSSVILALGALVPLAAEAASAASLASDAGRLGLGGELAWRRLLFYRPRLLGGETSMIDSPVFFQSPDGSRDPQAELLATIAAMRRDPAEFADRNEHPACRFPARRRFLETRLPGFRASIPRSDCVDFDRWRAPIGKEGVSLVFSSYFANNPASMFGHSFLRLHRSAPGGKDSSILDDTVNFMAYPFTANPVLYAINGLAGGFPGRFSMMPYYAKVQEYNNADSRDLWEYELAMTPAEIENLHEVIWEVGPPVEIDYYYFDENCSFVILMLVQAAMPDIDLTPPHAWVIPADTLRAVRLAPGVLRTVRYRPSSLSRFRAAYAALDGSPALQNLVDDIVGDNDPAAAAAGLLGLPELQQSRVIDAVVEYIDFDERVYADKGAVRYAELRQRLLRMRAQHKQAFAPVSVPVREVERPDVGPGTARLGAAAGAGEKGGLLAVSWRSALHDLAAPDHGYPDSLAIGFFDINLRYDPAERRAAVERYELLTVRSVPNLEQVVRPWAWSLALGADDQPELCKRWSLGCMEKRLRGGFGPAIGSGSVRGYLMATGGAGVSSEEQLGWHGVLGADAGVLAAFSPRLKLSLGVGQERLFAAAGRTYDRTKGTVELAWLFDADEELRGSVFWERERAEARLSWFHHY